MSTEAPYGYKDDGTPRRSAGGRPPGSKNRPKSGTRAAAPRRKPTPNQAAAPRRETDYSHAVAEQAMALGGIISLGSPLDGAVLMSCADEIGETANELAKINDHVRRFCERAMTLGPWGRITALGLRIGAQIAENHQWLPPQMTRAFGALPRDEFARVFVGQVEDMQARAGAQAGTQMRFGSDAPYPSEPNRTAPFERRDHAAV